MFCWVLGLLLLEALSCSPTKRQMYGIITSPDYPKPYPNDNQSSWDVAVPDGYRISLTFLLLDIEPSENCNYDYVKVSADKRDLGRFCGQVRSSSHPGHRVFVSQGNRMRIQFHSDFSNEENGTAIPYKGFQAYYKAMDRDECVAVDDNSVTWSPPCQQVCHNYVGGYLCSCLPGYQLQTDQRSCRVECSRELFEEESGHISSPGYPNPYPPDLKCNYSIRLEKGLLVSLSFQGLFEIDDHPRALCPYDTLKVLAGDRLLDSFCGRRSPGIMRTQSHSVNILFQTDESGESRGWKLHYTSEAIQCPNPVPRDKFTIISPLQQDYRMQDYIVVACQTGYRLMEGTVELRSFTALCQSDGTWHRPLPRCEIVSCEQPQALTNGQLEFVGAVSALTYQSVVTYSCNAPYYRMVTPTGSGMFTCSAQRTWKGDNGGSQIPLCLPVCGKPDNAVTRISRILGGTLAAAGNFPWQVLVDTNGRAGGVLIGDRWVLTAAHVLVPQRGQQNKVDSPSKVFIFMGHLEHDELIKMANYPVEEFHVHPDYRMENHDHDIALIRLRDPVVMNQNVSPICLPNQGNEVLYGDDKMGYVSGFGVTENNTISNKLRYVPLPMVSRSKCQEFVDEKQQVARKMGLDAVFSQNMFCAGYSENERSRKDSCQGDSGGAYSVENQDDTWVAIGLVSWGIGCGRGYGFYTKVSSYVDWINGYMGG
ncbi:complement C1r subcomponent isoform X2 [Ascaphus truei]|uniref:complement C1r subcomponent isoform X2 n=1 Tax=Ascaphus truei TaxID=8439 RepID=UPI003F5ABFDC